jgi:hypothetical protein
MPMAKAHTHGAGDHRRSSALSLLLQGTSASAAVSLLAEQEQISRRQAQRYVREGYAQIRVDIESCGVDRAHQVAKLVHVLESTIVIALEAKQCSAAVGAARELRELLGLAADR